MALSVAGEITRTDCPLVIQLQPFSKVLLRICRNGQCGTLDTETNPYPGLNGPISTDVQFADFARATKVCGGAFYTCALLYSGYVRCWGRNGTTVHHCIYITNASQPCSDNGVLGIGSRDETVMIGNSTNNPIDRNVLLNATATDIACGWAHVCALLVTDKVICWGRNNEGQVRASQFVTHSLMACWSPAWHRN